MHARFISSESGLDLDTRQASDARKLEAATDYAASVITNKHDSGEVSAKIHVGRSARDEKERPGATTQTRGDKITRRQGRVGNEL